VTAPHNTEFLLTEAKKYNMQQSAAQETQSINDRIYTMVTEESDTYSISSAYTGSVSGLYYRVFKPISSLADVQLFTRQGGDGGSPLNDATDQFIKVITGKLSDIRGSTPLYARVDVQDLQDHLPQVDDIYAQLTGVQTFSPYPTTHEYQNDSVVAGGANDIPNYEEPLSREEVLEQKRRNLERSAAAAAGGGSFDGEGGIELPEYATPLAEDAKLYGTTAGAKLYGSGTGETDTEAPDYVNTADAELPTYENTELPGKGPKEKAKSRFFGNGKKKKVPQHLQKKQLEQQNGAAPPRQRSTTDSAAAAQRCSKCKSKIQFCDCDGNIRTKRLGTVTASGRSKSQSQPSRTSPSSSLQNHENKKWPQKRSVSGAATPAAAAAAAAAGKTQQNYEDFDIIFGGSDAGGGGAKGNGRSRAKTASQVQLLATELGGLERSAPSAPRPVSMLVGTTLQRHTSTHVADAAVIVPRGNVRSRLIAFEMQRIENDGGAGADSDDDDISI